MKVNVGYPHKVGHAYIQYISHSSEACHFERSEKTLESAVCGFKGFLASLEMTGFAWAVNKLKMIVSHFMWVVFYYKYVYINFQVMSGFYLIEYQAKANFQLSTINCPLT